jgi:hypothetical protein
MYRNKFDKDGKCSVEGHSAEDSFEELAKSRGYLTRRSTREENMHKHIDMFLEGVDEGSKDSREVSVDIKARKRVSRRDKKFNDDWIWIEIKNVQGRNGWIHGDANFIAFERDKDFVVASRKSIVELIESKVRFDLGFVDRAHQAKYQIYQRKGRRDQITQVKMSDIIKLKNVSIWKK